jgi:hypothetical protein
MLLKNSLNSYDEPLSNGEFFIKMGLFCNDGKSAKWIIAGTVQEIEKFGKLQLAKPTLEREGHQKMFRSPGECTFNPSIITASAS